MKKQYKSPTTTSVLLTANEHILGTSGQAENWGDAKPNKFETEEDYKYMGSEEFFKEDGPKAGNIWEE